MPKLPYNIIQGEWCMCNLWKPGGWGGQIFKSVFQKTSWAITRLQRYLSRKWCMRNLLETGGEGGGGQYVFKQTI